MRTIFVILLLSFPFFLKSQDFEFVWELSPSLQPNQHFNERK